MSGPANDDVLPVVAAQDIEGVAAVDRSDSASDAADRKASAVPLAELFGRSAKANLANPANPEDESPLTVATLAGLAVADRKEFATLQARFALKEFSLVRMVDGVMYASRWGRIVFLADVAQAQAMLDKLGGAR